MPTVTDQPYAPQYPPAGHPPTPPGKRDPANAFEDRIKLGRDVIVGAVLALACSAFTAAGAWHGTLVADEFANPVTNALLAVAGLLFLAQIWYFVLREGFTKMIAAAIAVHLIPLVGLPILMFIGVNEQVLAERGVTETCTVVSQEKVYIRSGGEREPRYDHTLECPTGGELDLRTKPRARYDIGESVVITYDPEGRAGHRTGEPGKSPLVLFGAIAAGVFVLGTLVRAFYLRWRLRRGIKRRAAFGMPGI